MHPAAFANPGRFFKGNLHTHSTLSDGALEVAEVCARYRAQGYDFLALTEHFVGLFDYPIADTRTFRQDGFTTILGAELHSGAMDNGALWHILALGLPLDFAPSNSPFFVPVDDQESGPEIAARAAAAGAYVVLVHPEWSGLSERDALSIRAAHAVEVYNHGSEVECDRGRGLHTADFLANSGRRLDFIATDDAHFHHDNYDAFGGWTMVKAEENTPEALLAALKAGASYASCGPEFVDLWLDDRHVHVRTGPVGAITLMGAGVSTAVSVGSGLTEAKLPLNRLEGSPWCRVTLIDADGKKAWSNPIWLE